MVIFYTPKLLPILRTLFDFILCNDMGYYVNDYPYSVNDYFCYVYFKHTFYRFFTVVFGQKKTETPIFLGISVVLPKVYLGGRSDRSRIIDSQCEWGIRIVLFAKNNPPNCFLNAQT